MFEYIKSFFARRASVTSAVLDLEKAIEKLAAAEEFHNNENERHTYIVEQAKVDAAVHEYSAIRASRIRRKLSELLA